MTDRVVLVDSRVELNVLGTYSLIEPLKFGFWWKNFVWSKQEAFAANKISSGTNEIGF
jgi:hypothetical protein